MKASDTSKLKCPDCGEVGHIKPDPRTGQLICGNCGTPYGPPLAATAKAGGTGRTQVLANPPILATVQGFGGPTRPPRTSTYITRTTQNLGGGFVVFEPPAPIDNPEVLIRPDLQIPLELRVCRNPACRAENGEVSLVRYHDRERTQLLESGVCPKCAMPFSFIPVPAGTVIGGQYEIKGSFACGGCGFVYLAWDNDVGQWVVIKGMINPRDAQAREEVLKEKYLLANLRHPNIVSILGFKSYHDQPMIAMEFVDGPTFQQVRERHGGPLPAEQAMVLILRALPAVAYMHSRRPAGIIHCDLKPSNIVLLASGVGVKVLDAGSGFIVGTPSPLQASPGFAPPELMVDHKPVLASDLFSLGRTFLALATDVSLLGQYQYTLPTPDEVPVFAQYESLYRWLRRATAYHPDDRFASTEEMEQQGWMVLREMVALNTGTARPADCPHFRVDVHTDTEVGYQLLPTLKVDQEDPAKNVVESALMVPDLTTQREILEQAVRSFPKSKEAKLRLVHCLIELHRWADAERLLDEAKAVDPWDWREVWHRARLLLAVGNSREAYPLFDAVYSTVPGAIAPKLALGLASEMAGDFAMAAHWYDIVSRVEPAYTEAAFGLARCRLQQKDRNAAVEAYKRVPAGSVAHTAAVMGSVRSLIQLVPAIPGADELNKASTLLAGIPPDNAQMHVLRAGLLMAGVMALRAGAIKPYGAALLSTPFREGALREAAYLELLAAAYFAPTRDAKIELTDRAFKVRSHTII